MIAAIGWVLFVTALAAGAIQARIRMSLRSERRFHASKRSLRDMAWLEWEESSYTRSGKRLMNIAFALLLYSSITVLLGLGMILYGS